MYGSMRKLIMAAMVLAGCGSADEGMFNPGAWRGGMTGRMEVRLVDAPDPQVKEIWVTILHVDAHVAGAGWKTIASQRATIDLLKLQNGNFALLGVTQLPAGKLTQLRLYVDEAGDNHVVTPDGLSHPLKVPSGPESGIKLKLGLDLQACATGSITLDFDGKKSIWTHPRGSGFGDGWILRPVVRLKAVTAIGECPPGELPPGMGTPPGSPTPPDDTCIEGCGPSGGSGTGGGSKGGGNGNGSGGSGSTGTVATPSGSTPVSSGAPVDCGGATCSDSEVCYNGSCTADDIFMY
jgi:hypothetical protein